MSPRCGPRGRQAPLACTRHCCPLRKASPCLSWVSYVERCSCCFLLLPGHHQLPLPASTREAHGEPPSHPYQLGPPLEGIAVAGEGAWPSPSAEGTQRGMGDAAWRDTAARIGCPSAQMDKHLPVPPVPCQHCSHPGHGERGGDALSKGHLPSTLRAPRVIPHSSSVASCCFCTFSPRSSPRGNMASAPASLPAALQWRRPPGFLLCELSLQQRPPSPPSQRAEPRQQARKDLSPSAWALGLWYLPYALRAALLLLQWQGEKTKITMESEGLESIISPRADPDLPRPRPSIQPSPLPLCGREGCEVQGRNHAWLRNHFAGKPGCFWAQLFNSWGLRCFLPSWMQKHQLPTPAKQPGGP